MLTQLEELEKKYEQLTAMLGQEEVIRNRNEFEKVARERAEMTDLIETLRNYRSLEEELSGARKLLESPEQEIRSMAKEEVEILESRITELEQELKLMLLPKDPRDERNTIVEIRAGAGGDEAALFAADLFRMYTRYAENSGYKTEVLSTSQTGIGGIKEVIFSVSGSHVYSRMKYESGVHRVQRVPVTEGSGRIHTSTVTVAVLPEAKEVDIEVNPSDLRIDVFRAGGCGGQNVNKLETAIRITHIPSGIVVSCQDERSQLQNKLRAMKILRSRLLALAESEHHEKMSREKRKQLGTGDRSEKIRTYNFPQSRITDHRIGLTLHSLDRVLEGDLDPVIKELIRAEQESSLAQLGSDLKEK